MEEYSVHCKLICLERIVYKQERTYINTKILSLAYLDDMASLSECGIDALKMNVKTSEMIKSKKLKLSEKKCHVMHIHRGGIRRNRHFIGIRSWAWLTFLILSKITQPSSLFYQEVA